MRRFFLKTTILRLRPWARTSAATEAPSDLPLTAVIWPETAVPFLLGERLRQAHGFVAVDRDDIVEVRLLPSGRSTWHRAAELADTVTDLLANNHEGEHVYVGANPRRAEGGTKNGDVACARCLFADFDDVDDYHGWSSTPPVDRQGVPVPNADGFTRSAAVTLADPDDLNTISTSDQAIKQVVVTVSGNGVQAASLTAIVVDSP